MIPTIEFSDEEVSNGQISEANLISAIEQYRDAGFLVLKNVYKPEYIKTLNASFQKKYNAYLKDKAHKDALQVGDKRFMVSIRVETPFNNQKLYANPLIMPLIENLLGEDCIINSFGSVVSLPGAMDQNMHYDHPFLFNDDELDPIIPSYAITVIVPLVEITEQTGCTVMMKKSHRLPSYLKPEYGSEPAYPYAEEGTVILMDYKLRHAGQANRSDKPRPIMYNIYSRSWFRDASNYDNQPDLQISRKDFEKVPEAYKRLFRFAQVV